MVFGTLSCVLTIVLFSVISIPLITIIFALIATVRKFIKSGKNNGSSTSCKRWVDYSTALYSGRVSHTRFQPVVHGFSYPIFFMCVDLKEVDHLFSGKDSELWPLNLLMQFRDSDHLKNGEGLLQNKEKQINDIHSRIRRLVLERTKGKCIVNDDQTIHVLTHLSYFGYCFNPVSFYYIMKKGGKEIEAVVAEVSNTPWNEMSCYILHPDSVDVNVVQPGRAKDQHQSINYVFPKTFHVSPFMEMDHIYDWTFWTPNGSNLIVSTDMKHKKSGLKYFNAYFDVSRQTFSPFSLCYHLIRLPVFCAIIQLWIHWEAFMVFLKGVQFVPHPEGAETFASKVIGNIMTPFFASKDWVESKQNKDK